MSDTRFDPGMSVRERAYLLWERAGRPEGQADEFWEQAQRDEARAMEEARIDEEARDSFPASNPPSLTATIGEGRRDEQGHAVGAKSRGGTDTLSTERHMPPR